MKHLAYLAIALSLLLNLAHQASADRAAPARTCFPAKLWDGNDGRRPCVRVLRVFEDGSSEQRISRANGRELWRGDVGVPW
jgi:hypothetical protein